VSEAHVIVSSSSLDSLSLMLIPFDSQRYQDQHEHESTQQPESTWTATVVLVVQALVLGASVLDAASVLDLVSQSFCS
jgi:hypothetical protein